METNVSCYSDSVDYRENVLFFFTSYFFLFSHLHPAIMAEFFDDDWDKLAPEELARIRARVEAFYENTEDPILKEQIRATIKPLFAAQDAILQQMQFLLT